MSSPNLAAVFPTISDYGDIGCGRVVQFMPRETQVPVVLPPNADPTQYGIVTVRGPSLEEDGIHDGDRLVICFNFTKKDITQNSICVIYLHSTGELQAKKLLHIGDKVCIRSSGGGIEDKIYYAHEVEIRGVAISFQRILDEYGRLTRNESF